MHSENWDDLRYVLCVAETGSVLQAAKRLGVNHATVLRHVAAFEDRHATPVFERTARGYRLRPDSALILEAARSAEAAMREVTRLASGGRAPRSETIRITSTDTLCGRILPDFLAQVEGDTPDSDFVLLSSNAHLDLMREQAHIVVRPSARLAEDLVGDAAGVLTFGAYARDIAATRWFGLTGPLARSVVGKWMADALPEDRITIAADSFLTLAMLARIGDGIAILPRFVGDQEPGLTRLDGAMPDLTVPIWVARHVDATETHRMRAVQTKLMAFLQDRLKAV